MVRCGDDGAPKPIGPLHGRHRQAGALSAPLLSPAWFELSAGLLGAAPAATRGLAARILFDVDGRHVLVAVADGEPLTLAPATDDRDADLTIAMSADHAWAIASGAADGAAALAGCTVVEDRPDGRYEGPPSPAELGERPELADMVRIPGADLDVVYEYTRAPFGPLAFRMRVIDGLVDELAVGPPGSFHDADVVVGATFRQLVEVRRGEMTVLEAIVDGVTLAGSEGALALLAGISESPEFHQAELSCGRSGVALAALGEAVNTPAVADVLGRLREATSPPEGGAGG